MSAPQIDPNKLIPDAETDDPLANSEAFALDILPSAADGVRALLNNLPEASARVLRKNPVLVAEYARLVLLDRRSEERYLQGQEIIEALRDIRESIDCLAARPDVDDTSDERQPASKQAYADYAWLKELLERAKPGMSASDYDEAADRIIRIVGV
jgi:hypothetical protein